MRLILLVSLFSVSAFAQRPYFPVKIEDAAKNHHTHIQVTGRVALIKHERDGDTHIRLEDDWGHFMVAECIPSLPCPVRPKVGQCVTVRGIFRIDGEHLWSELHPIESLKIIPCKAVDQRGNL